MEDKIRSAAHGAGRVLVIEDEPGPRASLQLILKGRYEVDLAAGPEEALALLDTRRYDVLTLDLNLNGTDGMRLIEPIRKADPFVEIVAITAYGSLDVAMRLLGAGIAHIITKPFNTKEVLQAIEHSLFKRRNETASTACLSAPPVGSGASRGTEEQSAAFQGTRHGYLEFLLFFARTLEAKDPYGAGHSERVRRYCQRVAARLDGDEDKSFDLEVAALLHDTGKAGLPYHLLSKPSAPTFQEWQIIKSHPSRGVEMLDPLGFSRPVQEGIRFHHERYDGQGYPEGLKEDQIPLVARILAVCDAFDAMVSPRPYREALTWDEAVGEIRQGLGGQFDPEIGGIFLDVIETDCDDPDARFP